MIKMHQPSYAKAACFNGRDQYVHEAPFYAILFCATPLLPLIKEPEEPFVAQKRTQREGSKRRGQLAGGSSDWYNSFCILFAH